MALYAHARAEVRDGGSVVLRSREGGAREVVAL
jgi:hypothetical protein